MDILDSRDPIDPSAEGAAERSRTKRNRLVSIGLVSVGLVAGGTLATLGVANAGVHSATSASGSTTAPATGPSGGPGQSGPRPDGRPGFGRGFGGPGGGHELHGEATVQTGTNTYATIDTQEGSVTSNDGTTITVKSVDGFVGTYTFNSGSLVIKNGTKAKATDVKVGDKVDLRAAVQSSGNPVIAAVLDGKGGFGGPGDMGQRPDGHGPDGGPAPTASPSASTA